MKNEVKHIVDNAKKSAFSSAMKIINEGPKAGIPAGDFAELLIYSLRLLDIEEAKIILEKALQEYKNS